MLPGDSHKQNSRVKLLLIIFAIRIKEMKVKTYLWSHHKYLKFSGLRELFQTLRKTSKDYKVHIIVLSSSSPFIENFFPERRVLHSSARVKISWLDSWNQTKLYLVLTKQNNYIPLRREKSQGKHSQLTVIFMGDLVHSRPDHLVYSNSNVMFLFSM